MSFCEDGGIPVTGSSLILRCAIVQEGVIRRSDDEAVDVMSSGTSRAVVSVEVMIDVGCVALRGWFELGNGEQVAWKRSGMHYALCTMQAGIQDWLGIVSINNEGAFGDLYPCVEAWRG